jgi:hypothetical protein
MATKNKHCKFNQLCIQKTIKNKLIPREIETRYGHGLGLTK